MSGHMQRLHHVDHNCHRYYNDNDDTNFHPDIDCHKHGHHNDLHKHRPLVQVAPPLSATNH